MQLTALVANGGAAATSVDLELWVRGFDGTLLASTTTTGSVAAAGTWQHTFTLTAPAGGIALAEVVVRSDDDEAFARTNLAVLPSYDYQAGADSMFGIANYPWLQRPSADALLDLWQKVGIGLVRIAYDGGPGLPPASFDARGMRHNIELQPSLDVTDTAAATWAADKLAVAVGAGADYFEVGNELNRPFNTGDAAQAYLDKALRPVFDRRAATGDTVKLMNNGLAGMDKPWVENFIAAGGWDLIDAFAYHPGRGNFTPDYIPPGDDWSTGADGTYWNFYGGLKQLKALMAEHGEKEIWLTEAYAPTKPNSWWHDTYRHAAENVLLTLALAKAEGVRCVCWYQFHDSVLGMPQVADPDNVEYHYGLMNRDLSPKPSLLAYATAARTLDQATFRGQLTFADPRDVRPVVRHPRRSRGRAVEPGRRLPAEHRGPAHRLALPRPRGVGRPLADQDHGRGRRHDGRTAGGRGRAGPPTPGRRRQGDADARRGAADLLRPQTAHGQPGPPHRWRARRAG
jgi:hypothetical protein